MTESLNVHALHWQIEDKETSNNCVNIFIWALDVESKPYLLRIEDFPHSCYIELPTVVNNLRVTWTNNSANELGAYLKRKMYDEGHGIEAYAFTQKPKLYYHQEVNTNLLQLTFRNREDMTYFTGKCKYPIFYNGKSYIFKVWEDEVLIVRKLLSSVNLKYTQWFNIEGTKVPTLDKISILENEYIVNFRTISVIEDKICKNWVTNPGVLVIDGEMYSSNKKAMPSADRILDVCYMLSCIYQRIGKPETRKRYILIVGDCPDIDGVTVIRCKDEIELGDALADLTIELDPDIISGYNILSFDNPYLNTRRTVTGKPWKPMGRLIGKRAFLKPLNWQSSGGGYNSINFMVRPGRIEIDFYNIAKRELKLPKYTLNDVAMKILKEKKHDVTAQEMFVIYEESVKCTKAYNYYKNLDNSNPSILAGAKTYYDKWMAEFKRVGEYCIQDSELVIKLFDKWKAWIYLVELSKIQDINIEELFTGGQQKRVFSQIYDLASRWEIIVDRRDLPKVEWEGGFVHDPIPGLHDFVICLDFKSLYPSIIRAFNLCYRTLISPEMMDAVDENGKLIYDKHNCHVIEWDEEVEEKDEKDDEDLQETKKSKKKKKDVDPSKIRVVHYKYKFLKKVADDPSTHGLLPELVGNLIDGRNAVRGEMKGIEKKIAPIVAMKGRYQDFTTFSETMKKRNLTPAEEKKYQNGLGSRPLTAEEESELSEAETYLEILDKRQLGLKLTANSFFGALGVQDGGKLPLIEVARVITAKGRELILTCNKYVEEKYKGRIIYNDTDSLMVKLDFITNGAECIDFGHKLAKEVSSLFPKPLETEFEKAGRMFAVKKKKYAFWQMYMDDDKDGLYKKGELQPKDTGVLIKGMTTARRDNCPEQREIFTQVLWNILDRKPLQSTLDVIVIKILRLYMKKVHWENMVVIKGLGANYKSDSYYMNIFGQEITKIGKPAAPGDRLSFVIVNTPNPTDLLGYKMRLTETYIERLDTAAEEEIDFLYYIEKAIMNPIEQLWQIGYNTEIDALVKQYEKQDKFNVCNYIYLREGRNQLKNQEKIMWLYQYYQGDYDKIYDAVFLVPGMKGAAQEAQRHYISGRKVFHARIDAKPIKKFVKSIKHENKINMLEQLVWNLTSPEIRMDLLTELRTFHQPIATVA